MNLETVSPRIAVILNMLVWGLGYIYVGKVFKGTATFFLFAITCGFYLILFAFGFSFSLLIELVIEHFLSCLWFGYDAYNQAIKVKDRY